MNTSFQISHDLEPGDLESLASMHLTPAQMALPRWRQASRRRFFRDKLTLFRDFDAQAILIDRDAAGNIRGFLVHTHDEAAFNRFAGPPQGRFLIRLLKTACGLYGCEFRKHLAAARSMLGRAELPGTPPPPPRYGKIWALIVMPECRRQGVAEGLIRRCLAGMRERRRPGLRVTVMADNLPAIGTYAKCGFRKVGQCRESSGLSDVMQLDL